MHNCCASASAISATTAMPSSASRAVTEDAADPDQAVEHRASIASMNDAPMKLSWPSPWCGDPRASDRRPAPSPPPRSRRCPGSPPTMISQMSSATAATTLPNTNSSRPPRSPACVRCGRTAGRTDLQQRPSDHRCRPQARSGMALRPAGLRRTAPELDHRPVRLRQVVAGVRHHLRRRPAPLSSRCRPTTPGSSCR